MVIILDTPFGLGDLSDETYPHVYVTNLMINGPAQTVTVMAEVGRMGADNLWQGAPVNTSVQINMSGEQLIPFFFQKPGNMDDSLWDQVEALVYAQLQAAKPRFSGTLGDGQPKPETPVATPEPEPVPNAST